MNKETKKKLLAPFPKEYRKPAPKGRFGKYVPHYRYVERLRDCLGENYGWKVEAVYGIYKGEQRIVGAKGTITIEGLGTFDGVGDVKDFQLSSQADGTNYKFAESDAFKRACMHFGLGVELWSGDETEEEFMVNEAHKTKPIQKTGSVKDQVIEKEDTLLKAKQDFAKDVVENPNNTQELNEFMKATIVDDKTRTKIKNSVYKDVVAKGFPQDVNEWDTTQLDIFKDEVFNANEDKSPDTALAEEILGAEVTYVGPPNDENKVCPGCSNKGDVCDNRDKKASNPKMAKIPDFACQKAPYGNGCGWATWVGNADCPEEWI